MQIAAYCIKKSPAMSTPENHFIQETVRSSAPLLILLALAAVLLTSGRVTAQTDCDRAYAVFSHGRFASSQQKAVEYYLEAIELCPGFIRLFELVGNHYRKQGRDEPLFVHGGFRYSNRLRIRLFPDDIRDGPTAAPCG